MKIGITCYPTYGGSGVVATELGIELAARGHEVHFITSSQPFRLTGREAEHPLPRSRRLQLSALRVPALRPRARHPHGRGRRVLLARPAARPLRHPALRLAHCWRARCSHARHATFPSSPRCTAPTSRSSASTAPTCPSPFGIEQSDGVTAISSYLRDRTREAFNITARDRSHPQLRQLRRLHPQSRTRRRHASALRRSPDEKLLVHLSNFRPVKRVRRCRRGLRPRRRSDARRLMLIGDGPDRSAAEYLALRLGVQDRIHFLGKQDTSTSCCRSPT